MTRRLYYTNAYLAAFTSCVAAESDDRLRVYLDETAFYPTSGGQPHDLGTLGGIDVVDVVDEGERIAHVLRSTLPDPAPLVAGLIDWTRRFDYMQQHTGQHLLSAIFEDLFGFKTVSVHFGPDASTLDVDAELVTHNQIVAAEERVNAIVSEARPVIVSFEDAGAATGLRKASDRSGTLRIVSIDGLDRSACGGTHVRTTAEIGPMLLRSSERVRDATRVGFVCGGRAVHRARRDFESLSRIATSLSASLDDAANLVGGQAERLKEGDNSRRKLEKELAAFRARERYDAASPDADGIRTIVLRDVGSMDEIKAVAQSALALPKCVVVGALASPPSVLVAASEDSAVDAGKLLKAELAAAGGRGGGSPRMAQGSAPDAASLESLVRRLVTRGG
ncbi:MAG: alanyl-tRNA editing protein [Gemmatimonadales bacterium]